MAYKKLKAELYDGFHRHSDAGAGMSRVIQASKREYQKRSVRGRVGAFAFAIRQIGFIGWRIWLLQAAALSAMVVGLRLAFSDIRDLGPRHIPMLLSCCGILVALTCAPLLGRAVRFRMMETEAACRYSRVRLMAARLAIVALGDITMLLGIAAFAAVKTDIGLMGILYYAAAPSALLSALTLMLLPRVPARSAPGLIWCIGAFEMTAIWLLNTLCPSFASRLFGPVCAAACAVLLGIGVWSAARAVKRQALTDEQLALI